MPLLPFAFPFAIHFSRPSLASQILTSLYGPEARRHEDGEGGMFMLRESNLMVKWND